MCDLFLGGVWLLGNWAPPVC